MCGIGALLDPAGTIPADAARRMVEELRHRGPDGDAVKRAGAATLCHTRLAIIDVEGGDQPLDSEEGGVVVVVKGEIHTPRARRPPRERRGPRSPPPSDCEVIAHA